LDDLHNFVSVALHTTAGESDYDSDRLSNLKKVGNGFGPLIFGLMENKSFEVFHQGCIDVWKAMENAPDLPQKLVSIAIIIFQYDQVFLNFFSVDVNQSWLGTSLSRRRRVPSRRPLLAK
jgi:hypothetical protein